MKNKFKFLSLFIIVLAAAQLTNLFAQENKNNTLRILTYNVHHCNPPSKPDLIDMNAIVKVINDAKPDIVALQEIDVYTERSGKESHQAKELAALTGMNYFFAKTIDHQGGDYGIAILSKYPMEQTEKIKLPMAEGAGGEPRCVAGALIQLPNGQNIIFASTHMDLKEDNKKIQIDFMTKYVKEFQYDFPIILAGDFNSKPDSYVVKELDKIFQRTCTECPFTIPQVNPNRTIDYIAFTPKNAFTVVKHEVIAEPYASDHLPVLAELEIKN